MATNDAEPSEAELALVGTVIAGKFYVEDVIGRGATAVVYKAKNTALNAEVALKVLHQHRLSDARLTTQFEAEARAAARLNHQNCVEVLDYSSDSAGHIYVAMELLKGKSLKQELLESGAMPVRRIVRIVLQVLSALDEAHAQRIIHRDIKPENIMIEDRLNEPDFVKVLDFSPALDATSGNSILGTPEYMSPEQARNEPLDERTDIYAVGAMMYHMATGVVPFSGDTPLAIVTRHLKDEVMPMSTWLPVSELHPKFEDLVRRCMSKPREHRPRNASELAMELSDLIPRDLIDTTGRVNVKAFKNIPIASPTPTPLPVVAVPEPIETVPVDRKKAVAIGVGVFAAVLIVTIALVLSMSGGDPEAEASTSGGTPQAGDNNPEANLEDTERGAIEGEGEPPQMGADADIVEADAAQGNAENTDAVKSEGSEVGSAEGAPADTNDPTKAEGVDHKDNDAGKSDESEAKTSKSDAKSKEKSSKKTKKPKEKRPSGGSAINKRMLSKARKLIADEAYDDAAQIIDRVLKRDPGNAEAKKLKGQLK